MIVPTVFRVGHGNAAAINSTEISIPAINTTCPYWFTDNKINIITCVVDNDAVSKAGCLNRSTTVQMRVERPENSTFTCSVPQYDNTSRCGPIASLNGWCKCVSYRGKRFTYQLNYFANEAIDEGANVTCQIDCLSPSTPIRQTTFGSCSPIMFCKRRKQLSYKECSNYFKNYSSRFLRVSVSASLSFSPSLFLAGMCVECVNYFHSV